MLALMLLAGAAPALADGRDVLIDAQDGRIDRCYSQAEFHDALARARADQRLYDTAIGVIREGRFSNVRIPGQPCGRARTAPSTDVAPDDDGIAYLWSAALGLVAVAGLGGGAIARRARP